MFWIQVLVLILGAIFTAFVEKDIALFKYLILLKEASLEGEVLSLGVVSPRCNTWSLRG